jgi:hypothetical protein
MRVIPTVVAMLLMGLPVLATAQDYKVIKLEQDVRNLEQQVRELSRQIAELRSRSGTASPLIQVPERDRETQPGSPPWLQVKRWQGLRVGMSELQVIEALGPPTSARVAADGDNSTLFYALEIATERFLGGSVELQDHRVTRINTPVLK